MNLQTIKIPPALRQITMNAAEQRRCLAEKADGCVRWLKAQGFDVVRVEKGAVGPRVIIRPSLLCKKLEGAVSAYERGPAGERRYSFAFRFECEVRWAHEGAAS